MSAGRRIMPQHIVFFHAGKGRMIPPPPSILFYLVIYESQSSHLCADTSTCSLDLIEAKQASITCILWMVFEKS